VVVREIERIKMHRALSLRVAVAISADVGKARGGEPVSPRPARATWGRRSRRTRRLSGRVTDRVTAARHGTTNASPIGSRGDPRCGVHRRQSRRLAPGSNPPGSSRKHAARDTRGPPRASRSST
jgi:hypothetical protein